MKISSRWTLGLGMCALAASLAGCAAKMDEADGNSDEATAVRDADKSAIGSKAWLCNTQRGSSGSRPGITIWEYVCVDGNYKCTATSQGGGPWSDYSCNF